ncbi:hypothetical protein [Orenia metallireducens]
MGEVNVTNIDAIQEKLLGLQGRIEKFDIMI